MEREDGLLFTGDALGENPHICGFFGDTEELYRVLVPWIKDGFDQGDRGFHVIDPELQEEHLRQLNEAGIDVAAAVRRGQLEVHTWYDAQLRGPRFDVNEWLKGFEQSLEAGGASGSARTVWLAQMGWALAGLPGLEDFVEFEARVNHVVPKYGEAVVCAYDLSKFGATTVMYALRTHPLVIIGGRVQHNPFYVEPDQFLEEIREQRPAAPARAAMRAE
jgi:hypothetical protein